MTFDIKVMTRNLYVGADFQPIIQAALTDRQEVPKAAAAVFAAILASDFPARAECVAAEIAAHRPHVVGLQEAFIVRHRKPSSLVVPPFEDVVMGDLNTRADDSTTATRRRFMDDGYADAWIEAGQGPGLTCKAEELRDPARRFSERIDYVLCRNIRPVAALVTGEDPANRTPSGLWPSDHGGVVATLRV